MWLANWVYRKEIAIAHTDDGAQSNYQIKLLVGESSGSGTNNVHCAGHLAYSDYRDLRFTASDGTTLCDYWIESLSGSTPNQVATVWIKVPSIAAHPNNTTIYMYYGNSGASAGSTYDALITYATGDGIITAPTTYERVHTFLLADSGTHFVEDKAGNITALVVAGGGGVVYVSSTPISVGSYLVTVGDGGNGGGNRTRGDNGSDSEINGIGTPAIGGGGGGNWYGGVGLGGGCGGGGASSVSLPYGGAGSQGGDGGAGKTSSPWTAGGGGGAKPDTGDTGAVGGDGGEGYSSTIYNGTSEKYAGGGGGSSLEGTQGDGVDGGGAGSITVGGAGTANTGGGGGGAAGIFPSTGVGGKGGSGIVIIRYQWRNYTAIEPAFSSAGVEAIEIRCYVTGTVITAAGLDIISGGKTIVLTLDGSTWVAAGAAFNAIRGDIIAGMNSAQAEARGWNAVYKANANMYVADVVRTNDTDHG